jgi:hypothetical protein
VGVWSAKHAGIEQIGCGSVIYPKGGVAVLLEILRIGFAFGAMGLIIWFWYWFMESLGTF